MATSHQTAAWRLTIRIFAIMTGLMASLMAGLAGAYAAESDWIGDPQIGEVRLVSAVMATGDLDRVPLGIEFTLAAGWKVYWRTPGEAGLAPVIDLTASPNPDLAGRISWPLPKRFDAFGGIFQMLPVWTFYRNHLGRFCRLEKALFRETIEGPDQENFL